MRTTEELLDLDLPKWPQMYVTGVPVTNQQALEIIRRTDTFFRSDYGGGNDRRFTAWVQKIVGAPTRSVLGDSEKAWREYTDARYVWHQRWGYIETSYVDNSWVACSFIGGPHGWVHPDGTIGFVDNVGKWPTPGDIYADWKLLAREFPFLEIGVTLMSGESCEDDRQPVVSFKVSKGAVEVLDPQDPEVADVHAGHPKAFRSLGSQHQDFVWGDYLRSERGLSDAVIEAWGRNFKEKP